MNNIYDFTLTLHDGKLLDLKRFKGHPILIANTASKCKYTPQYEELQDIWTIYHHHYGLIVIGIPSADFGQQEFETNEEIRKFCQERYNVGFFLGTKSHVKGHHAIPLFQWIAKKGGILSKPRWNFYKYIFDKQGELSAWFSSVTRPCSKRIRNSIEKVACDI